MMRILLSTLLVQILCCSGLPVDDDKEGIMRAALNASLSRVNSQSWGTSLLRVTRSIVKRVNYLGEGDADYDISLEFSVRETTCNKNSAQDPMTCAFRLGRYVGLTLDSPSQQQASCRSRVRVSGGQARAVSADCHRPRSSSESSSSEETFQRILSPYRGGFGREPEGNRDIAKQTKTNTEGAGKDQQNSTSASVVQIHRYE
ncbi:secreted phosphoprotein 24 [Ascaphus truei]|uniref:secreted phosphoprotein 24 n=1 Tax=Ascaphus truei TaxID=8439 RepID=UPI003F5A5B14